jgi:hypothetical protein
MGAKWTESRDPIVTDWSAYRAMIVSAMRYDGTTEQRESAS